MHISKLRPAEYNPRKISDAELLRLRKSIREFGMVQPIVVNMAKGREGIVIGGHQRLQAAAQEGIDEVPVIVVKLDEKKEKALNLALNKISGDWDQQALVQIIDELKTEDIIDATGFDDAEISRLLDSLLPEDEEDDDKEEQEILDKKEADSVPGQVYELGPHRLICGDATDPEVYAKLFEGVDEKAQMIFTDPPYNVDYSSRMRSNDSMVRKDLENDAMSPEEFREFLGDSIAAMVQFTKSNATIYLCNNWKSYPDFATVLGGLGLDVAGLIVWVKNNTTMGYNDYRYKHEFITKTKTKKRLRKRAEFIAYVKRQQGAIWNGGRDEADVWEGPRKDVNSYLHPTEKPDWLPMRAIKNSSTRGGIILDPFAGSGSTLAAAQKTGRRAFLVELDPLFCDVIRHRWDKKLKHLSHG